MKKVLGILALLVAVIVITAIWNPAFLKPYNLQNTMRWTGLFGIMGIGVAFVIITGGIDLSMGSVVGLVGCLLPIFLGISYGDGPDVFPVVDHFPEARQFVLEGDGSAITRGDRLVLRGKHRDVEVNGETQREPVEVKVVSTETDGERTTVEFDRPITPDLVPDGVSHRIHVGPRVVGWCLLVLLVSAVIGAVHGLLITKMRLQPFIITLCGLLVYRGIARGITDDQTQGFGQRHEDLQYLATGKPFDMPAPLLAKLREQMTAWREGTAMPADVPVIDWIPIPMSFIIFGLIAVAAGLFLNYTIYGRYLLALGRNEQAARFSGINTDRMVLLAYVICSLLAGVAGILFALDLNSIQPSGHGNFYELYAIAAAVLGGCSLRGGEGSILGVVIGAAILRVLYNAINVVGISTRHEYTVIGVVILAGVVVDELVKRVAAQQRAAREAMALSQGPGSEVPSSPQSRPGTAHPMGMGAVRPMSKSFFIGSYIVSMAVVVVGSLVGAATMRPGDAGVGGVLLIVAFIALIYMTIVMCVFIYTIWAAIQDGHARTTPGKAVGFGFIPIFNFYWVFVVYRGWAEDFNRYVTECRIPARPAPVGLAYAISLITLATAIPYVGAFIGFLNVFLVPIFISHACDGVNTIAAWRNDR